jgi:hypothetical protein
MLISMFCASPRRSLFRALALLALVCSPARTEPAIPVQAYGETNADCLEWTDSCVICVRREGAEPACSTPGIACRPGEIACSASREKTASPPESR